MNRRSRFVYWQKERLSTSNNSGCYHGSDETFLIILPSGSALLKLRAVMMLFTSLSILLATPGYWKSRFDCVWCLYKVAGLGHSSPPSLVSPESSWQPLCRLSASRDALDRWRPLQMASPQSTPAGLSSWGRGRCWWLSAERRETVLSMSWAYCSLCCALSIPTIICLEGMKSALCRTRSKILASWGLMKASSERRDGEQWELRICLPKPFL